MPDQFANLLTVSGLVTLTVLVVGLLKALRGPEGTFARIVGDWVRDNQFVTSVVVAASIAAAAYAVQYFGYLDVAEEYWKVLLLIWSAAQAVYNGQKGVARVARGRPN